AKTEVTVNSGAVTVTGAGDEANATGVNADAHEGGSVDVKTGTVTAISYYGQSTGINATTSGGGTVTVNTGTVNSSTRSESKGVYVENTGGSIVVTTGAVVSNSSSNNGRAYGASISGRSGTTTVNTGSISVDSERYAEGIHASSFASQDNHETLVNITTGSIQAIGGENNKGVVVSAQGSMGTSSLDLTVNGSVNTSGTGVDVSAGNSNVAEITVTQDINAGNTAVLLFKDSDQASLKLEVDGTISGKEHNIVIEESSTTEGIDITVWKVDTSDGKEVIAQKDNVGYFIPENAAEIVNYIIKVEGNL
ncbi:hypothetical protein BXO88_16205, partial [Oribacterium sp. C9]|uniref:hypothetical protein n=1 Tax=Oribacterium sp. C9 TaxID=1943579 RepID=UPI0009CB0956